MWIGDYIGIVVFIPHLEIHAHMRFVCKQEQKELNIYLIYISF